ncbi:phosphoribosylformylglycinamidine synthase subunit PurS [Kroppenstedtia eburnea]|uniref:Phosphoribosylformylglycinamidine synthase subunit PurS n=1 Tax=Kroppenstedtia eburnea TaxID=714067 RepID=A0A1N7NHS2_9BACL|nr:phosphoribosylformylglycinamidine synthase subunit PurS [Kroppenstedtia eburnea]QKI80944.1 phosphoribosylformylglycinamidine synthase subunit PurS [Kroppenstedtia eburnea]SIS97862.1 phosphoribosylformylglycinamidine synthase [Kroppenstedtia eburnea]
MYKAIITVRLKPSVLDPQGTAVKGSLHSLGYSDVEEVRIGKTMELWLNTADRVEAGKRVDAMCRQLLANPVIEDYEYRLEEGS